MSKKKKGRIFLVSNRLPIKIVRNKGDIKVEKSAGGLATGIASLQTSMEKHWVGWPGITPIGSKEKAAVEKAVSKHENIHPVFYKNQKQFSNFYEGFSNSTLWPLFHYFLEFAEFKQDYWDSYVTVNRLFCDKVVSLASEGDTIWVQDYHLMLLPQLIREKLPNARIGFFLHIPFPSYELFRIIPWRKQLLEGVLGSDLIGFHTYSYMRHFDSAVYRITGNEVNLGQIRLHGRLISIDTFPMGIDYKKFSETSKKPEVQQHVDKFMAQMKNQKVVLSVDRLDYTKGIINRLIAIDQFFTRFPEYKEKVVFVQLVVPSRDKVKQYRLMKEEIDERIGKINGKHATFNWQPINYYYRSVEFTELIALYKMSVVCLVSSLRDGMNLVAKEYVASNNEGALVLSELAGASSELSDAVSINPFDTMGMAEKIREALELGKDDRQARMQRMQKKESRQTVNKWAADFLETLQENIRERQRLEIKELTTKEQKSFVSAYEKSSQRLILLDYDGTLTGFTKNPQEARPDEELLGLLKNLTEQEQNKVVIISGRDHQTLDNWLGHLDLDMITEHGVKFRKNGNWQQVENIGNSWKNDITDIMQLIVEKTPGSFIEEKPFSLVWHYRNSDVWLADIRLQELLNLLIEPVQDHELSILNGKKVLEVKLASIDKGKAAAQWVEELEWDFIMAAGDDQTDEFLFRALPEEAWSIKVGEETTSARFFVRGHLEIRQLLKKLSTKASVLNE